MKYLLAALMVLVGCHADPGPPDASRPVMAMGVGPDPQNTGLTWGINGVSQGTNFGCEAGLYVSFDAGGFPVCATASATGGGALGSANGADVFGPFDAGLLVLQITGDGGTNEFGGTSIIPVVAHESVLACNSTHPVKGASKGFTTTDGGLNTMLQYTPGTSTFDKWTLSVVGVNSGFVAGDAGLVDYYETDYVFDDSVGVDGGCALSPSSPTTSRASCSGAGCSWTSSVTMPSCVLTVSVSGSASTTVRWNAAIQGQEQH